MRFITWNHAGIIALIAFAIGAPTWYYRAKYDHTKRLREVEPGKVYRSGQLTSKGFREAVRLHGFKTVINVQNEEPDPKLRGEDRTEKEVCQELGVKYVFISPDLLERNRIPKERPQAIDEFLKVMDDPANYPVLVHCRAGLHRTGCLVAVYRMEYQGWTWRQAVDELVQNGFGRSQSSARNDYIMQYIMAYQPRRCASAPTAAKSTENLAARP
jgi:tyrosine-protein phosphatase SIW14